MINSKSLKCIIIDDEIGAITILENYIARISYLELKKSFRNSVKALNYLLSAENIDIDIVFLDIDMPELDGMQIAEILKDRDVKVIFTTAYSEFAVKSYEKNAIDYLLKPFSFERFDKCLKKLKNDMNLDQINTENNSNNNETNSSTRVFIKSGFQIHRINTDDILYMEKDGHYVTFFLRNRSQSEDDIVSRMNLSELINSLPEYNFLRIHKSYVVALDKIDIINKHSIIIDKKEIPIGESFKKNFFSKIDYSGN